ncbi:hypothetical protein BD413DRAFT_464032 [Trametes elegans]|nr:hypothetical protein BD413DRAFT_464032 [Trametes elegans]
MAGSQTCSACRGRKVRCDGVLPVCGPCSKARRPVECEYTSSATIVTGPKGEYLKKGAACVPCRYVDNAHTPQKCDAKRPSCSTCKVAGKEKDCTYDENVERTLTEALFMRTHELEQRLAVYENHLTAVRGERVMPEAAKVRGKQPVASTSHIPDVTRVPSTPNDGHIYNIPQALHALFNHISTPSPTLDLHSMSTPAIPQGLEEL